MGKKKNHSAPAAAGSSGTKAIDELRNLNDELVKEVTECRKQIKQLQFQLATLASHKNILAGSETNVSSIAERQRGVSSGLTKAAAHNNAEMAVKKIESATAELDAEEMLLLALVREKDEIQSNVERSIWEKKDCAIWCLEQSLEQSRKKSDVEFAGGRKWKRWICSVVVATASFFVVVAVVTLCCPKSFNPKT